MGPEVENVELISFHSVSKGMVGECGKRGGYMECVGLHPETLDQLYKAASISLCPNILGQVMVDLMVEPPVAGDPSYALYHAELNGIYESLRRRASQLVATFNSMEGVSCQDAVGSMYAFPSITLPPAAVAAAEAAGKAPDVFYCLQLLDATGVCVVPGSGFGQKSGTWHFRCTFLPPESFFDEFLADIKRFHQSFLAKYSS